MSAPEKKINLAKDYLRLSRSILEASRTANVDSLEDLTLQRGIVVGNLLAGDMQDPDFDLWSQPAREYYQKVLSASQSHDQHIKKQVLQIKAEIATRLRKMHKGANAIGSYGKSQTYQKFAAYQSYSA